MLLLTGGASRMGFVQPVCRATFSDSDLRRDSEPEFCIALGLAHWGRVDLRTAQFKCEVDDLLDSALPDLLEAHILALKRVLGECLAKGLIEKVVKRGMYD